MSDVLSGAHDMKREWRFVSALADSAVPVAPPVAYCDDRAVCADDFYLMEFVDGVVLDDRGSADHMAPEARHRAGIELVRLLAELHRLDAVALGRAGSNRGEGYVARQLARWSTQVAAVAPPEQALLAEGHDLLAPGCAGAGDRHRPRRLPPRQRLAGPDGDVRAIFDWELATAGDVLADLGWIIATWAEPGDAFLPDIAGPSADGGFATRAELVDAYAEASGRPVHALDFYVAFAQWRLCCIAVGVRHRYQAGAMGDDGFDPSTLDEQIAIWGRRVVDALS